MRRLTWVLYGGLLTVSACVGERPTFGQAATSETSQPNPGTASDASPDLSADALAEPIPDNAGESDARDGTDTGESSSDESSGTALTSNETGATEETNLDESKTDESDTTDSDGENTGDSSTDEAGIGDSSTDETQTAELSTDGTQTGETTADQFDANGSTSDPEECPKSADPERVCTSQCPCAAGAGTCTDSNQCEAGLVCTPDAAAKLGYPGASCLPAHCVNDRQDAEETSVDCGGECGCRATYEVVQISGLPADASGASPSAMSGDGSAFAASLGRGRTSYPARISADGVVTELEGFGAAGSTYDISTDGSVVIGFLGCEDPPACTSSNGAAYRWAGTAAPEVVYNAVSGRVLVSATGAIAVGEYYDTALGRRAVYRITSNQSFARITALDGLRAISADGLFIAGRLATADEGAIWSHQQNALVSLSPPADWSRWEIAVMNADGSAFAGYGYNASLETSHGYVWRDGEFSELPQLQDAEYTTPYAMDASGTVVIGISGTNSYQQAFIWDEEQGTRRVLDEVRTRGLELPVDLELINAEFLSDDGHIVVGRVNGTSTPSFWRVTLLD